MRLSQAIVIWSLVSCIPSTSSADLSSGLYTQAKQLYQGGDCRKAAAALRQYETTDASFLVDHADVKRQIDSAIQYCDSVNNAVAIAGGLKVTVTPIPPPRLP
jgi:hypothetical protein